MTTNSSALDLESSMSALRIRSILKNLRTVPQKGADLTLPNLFLGNSEVATNMRYLTDHRITHIVSVCHGSIPAQHQDSPIQHLRIAIDDDSSANILPWLPAATQWIGNAINNENGVVLVHSTLGKSRSVAVVAAYVMRVKNVSVAEALERVRERREQISIGLGFQEQLTMYGMRPDNPHEGTANRPSVTDTTNFMDLESEDHDDQASDIMYNSSSREDFSAIIEWLLDLSPSEWKENRSRLLEIRTQEAVNMLDALQKWLDTHVQHEKRRKVITLLLDIAKASQELPSSLFVTGVHIDSPHPTMSGGFADVFRGVLGSQSVALKRLRINVRGQAKEEIHRKFCKEGLIWRQLKHPHILAFIGVDRNTFSHIDALGMVSPWIERGTLMEFVESNDYDPMVDRLRLIIEVGRGLEYLHVQGMAHGDLHGSNIFITDEGHACIADFGLTVISDATLTHMTTSMDVGGAAGWLAPEAFSADTWEARRTTASDVFAFGRLCWALHTRRNPFYDMPAIRVIVLILQDEHPSRPSIDDCDGFPMSDDIWALVNECWAKQPEARPRLAELLERLKDFDMTPPYLKPDYKEHELVLDIDHGTVRAGIIDALIERLTTHETLDEKFRDTFMMTWKTFVGTNALVEHLIKRFFLRPPDALEEVEYKHWQIRKLNVVRSRHAGMVTHGVESVLSCIEALVQDDYDLLDKDTDQHVYGSLRTFLQSDEVRQHPRAALCMKAIERAEKGEKSRHMFVNISPPPPIMPRKTDSKLKLRDIDSREMARQLTILEYRLFSEIQPLDYILQLGEPGAAQDDNVHRLIKFTNSLATWVADFILSEDDLRRRCDVIRYFIRVAHECLFLRSFNSVFGLTPGLLQPAVRRLKHTWEHPHISQRTKDDLNVLEWTVSSDRSFGDYRVTLERAQSPCIPFLGIYVTQLQFVHKGHPDNFDSNLINFTKREKLAHIITDMRKWQSQPHGLVPVQTVIEFIEESLKIYTDSAAVYHERFWSLSFRYEPRGLEE